MACVSKGDLASVSSVVASLENDDSDTTNLINAINGFINDSQNTLIGAGYNAARQKMGLYLENVQSRQKISAQLASAISSGAASLAGYMGEYDVLDDSEIEEIAAEIDTLKSKISSARQTIYQITISNETSENPISTSYYYGCINNWNNMLAELEKKLERLIGLGAADAAAFGEVNAACGDVAKYDASIQGIKISSIR